MEDYVVMSTRYKLPQGWLQVAKARPDETRLNSQKPEYHVNPMA